jgi:hypothetical protein
VDVSDVVRGNIVKSLKSQKKACVLRGVAKKMPPHLMIIFFGFGSLGEAHVYTCDQ